MNNEVCSKCGAELKVSDRACIRCGTLNPNNPLNKDVLSNLKKSKIKHKESDLENNIGYNVMTVDTSNRFSMPSLISFILVNGLIYFFLLFIILNSFDNIDFVGIGGISLIYFYIICYQLLIKKAGFFWFSLFIPIYNIYVLYKMVFNNWLIPILLSLLPYLIIIFLGRYLVLNNMIDIYMMLVYANRIIPSIISIIYCFKLGRRFGRSGILTVLFGFIIIPVIALSNRYQYY